MSAAEVLCADLPEVADWRRLAVCKSRTELFFGPSAERPEARARREARALQLCAVCPVQGPCRQWARRRREYGFWGGESEEARYRAGFTVTAAVGVRSGRT
ncbi:MAG TPA: WhiB family transcriptional regulator [Ilumatobacter sp.]